MKLPIKTELILELKAARLIFLIAFWFSATVGASTLPSLEEKIGQMLLIGFKSKKQVIQDIKKYHIGGVIVQNSIHKIPSGMMQSYIQEIKESSYVPLFISIDEEGGYVQNLSPRNGGYRYQNSATKMAKTKTTYRQAMDIADEVSSYGMNLNFAPVVDINLNPQNPVIGRLLRSFGSNASEVIKHSTDYIKAHHEYGVITSLKHFPGHGSSADDSHHQFVDVTNVWKEEELKPFQAHIDAGYLDMIMIAHVFNRNLDDEYPASLSKKTVTDLLRTEMGYEGVVITDDLYMRAISNNYDLLDSIRLAINAGVDILLLSHIGQDYSLGEIFQSILNMVQSGEISEERINQSYQRIIKLKDRL